MAARTPAERQIIFDKLLDAFIAARAAALEAARDDDADPDGSVAYFAAAKYLSTSTVVRAANEAGVLVAVGTLIGKRMFTITVPGATTRKCAEAAAKAMREVGLVARTYYVKAEGA